MKADLQKELYDRHLNLLNKTRYIKDMANHSYPKYGIQCNDGWFKLIDDLFLDIEKCCSESKTLPLILQVKEKFGTLRVYFTYTGIEEIDERLDNIVQSYTNKSIYTCELCGCTGQVINKDNYLQCLCSKCVNK